MRAKITTKCAGCTRLMYPNDPKCISCENQRNYLPRHPQEMISIDRELGWFKNALNPNDVKVMFNRLCGIRSEAVYTSKKASATNPTINKVYFNPPVTVVLWSDKTKTIVRCQEGDVFDFEKGLAMAISKKYFGNKGNYCEVFKKWTQGDVYIDTIKKMRMNHSALLENLFVGNPIVVEKVCSTCKHSKMLGYRNPCINCFVYSNWTPSEEE